MITDNIIKLAADLEKQELDMQAKNETPPPQLYAQLLAIYLYQNDLCNAKYLWQRIPDSVKKINLEITAIWEVGRCMWQRDLPSTYAALNNPWSDTILEIMTALQEAVRSRAADLIGQAYSSVTVDMVSAMTGLNSEQVVSACREKNWTVEDATRMVTPCRPPPPPCGVASSEDQLYKLTEFVSFLEN